MIQDIWSVPTELVFVRGQLCTPQGVHPSTLCEMYLTTSTLRTVPISAIMHKENYFPLADGTFLLVWSES